VREEERNHRPTTTENTQRRLFVFVLNLRALISSRARVSLSLALLFREKKRRRKRRRSTKRNRERHRNNRGLKEEDEEDERKRRARDDDIVVTSFSKGNSGHRKLSLHFPFRVFKLSEKKYAERTTQIFFYSSSSE
jgi:hypothetical protein